MLQIQIGHAAQLLDPEDASSGEIQAAPVITITPGGESSLTYVDCCAPGLLMRSRMRLPRRVGQGPDVREGSHIWCDWSEPVQLLPLRPSSPKHSDSHRPVREDAARGASSHELEGGDAATDLAPIGDTQRRASGISGGKSGAMRPWLKRTHRPSGEGEVGWVGATVW